MIFIQPEYRYFLKSADQVREYESGMHSLREMFLKLHNQVAGKSCLVVGNFSGAPEKALEILLLCHTLKKEGALKVSFVSPYLAYGRQDQNQESQSYGLKWAVDSLAACGVDEIITLDEHNSCFKGSQKLPLNLINISPQCLWDPYIYAYAAQEYSFVFPDKGAYIRYGFLHKYAWAYFEKKRSDIDIQIVGMQGRLHTKVVIIDDILDSGETLFQTCIMLQKLGVVEIVIFVTHAVVSSDAWQQLFLLGVVRIYFTDSLPGAAKINHPLVRILSIRPLLEKYLL